MNMHRTGSGLLILVFSTVMSFGQSAPSASPTPPAVGHGAFPVKVTKALDSGKLKEGDRFEVETAGSFKLADGTLVSKGAKLTGHVTASKARARGDSESELTIVFDKLDLGSQKQLIVKGSVQAVFPPPDEANPGVAVSTMSKAGGPGYQPSDVKSGSNLEVNNSAPPFMDPKSVGVQGIHDLDLSEGVLRSKGKQVKLGSGVRMIVHVDILGEAN